VVYARETHDSTLTFQVSGMLWRNSLIMRDRETGTLWSHVTGDAISGPKKGSRLVKLPSVQTTWERWRAKHPDTEVLKKDEEVLSSHYQKYFSDPDRTGIFRARWLMEKMPGKEMVYGTTVGPHAVAATDDALADHRPATVDLGGKPVTLVRGMDGGVRAFKAIADGRAITLIRQGETWNDSETGSTWDLGTGTSTDGELAGTVLDQLTVTPVYWFAWSSFYPNTKVVD
jgi:hypothetical protein